MRCPLCKLENPPSALRCDCGYDFQTQTKQASYLKGSGASPRSQRAKLPWYQYVWAGVPLFLIVIGGMLGGLIGGVASGVNIGIFQTRMNPAARYVLTAAISVMAFVLYFLVAFYLLSALRSAS